MLMDKFPDDFNREYCIEQLTENQKVLIKEARYELYNKIKESISNSKRYISYIFPDNLWQEHRIQLTKEILIRFKEVSTMKDSTGIKVTRTILDPTDIPKDIQGFKIQF